VTGEAQRPVPSAGRFSSPLQQKLGTGIGMAQPTFTVAAAFAQERDVHYAVRLLSVAVESKIDFTMRCVRGEDDSMQMCILEAAFSDPTLTGRVETAMAGAHGVVVPADVLAAAEAG
jgi:hypothetical protein